MGKKMKAWLKCVSTLSPPLRRCECGRAGEVDERWLLFPRRPPPPSGQGDHPGQGQPPLSLRKDLPLRLLCLLCLHRHPGMLPSHHSHGEKTQYKNFLRFNQGGSQRGPSPSQFSELYKYKCVFNKRTISCSPRCPGTFASNVRDTWRCPCISEVPEATHIEEHFWHFSVKCQRLRRE